VRRCTVCSNLQVTAVNVLLASGSSVRQVARVTGIPRTTLARHREHVPEATRPLGLIRAVSGPNEPADPLAEAFLLAERARTPRERLRALEQIRSGVKLRLRGVVQLDGEDRALLDANIGSAEQAYRNAGDFETVARALSGWREAILQRLDAAGAPVPIDVPVRVTQADGTALDGDEGLWHAPPEAYWRGVPRRFRDSERFAVHRVIKLALGDGQSEESVKMYDTSNGSLVWVN
jgi:hypothetical protein